ncbi:MAG TPA: class I SAM-dependent methyltransferase [Elusimicrobiota bacterium]|nr:class I SAM-dependent methyltransferase [Elusimicrobiota bacterium]
MRNDKLLLEYLMMRWYYVEKIMARRPGLEKILRFRFGGRKPFLSLLLRCPERIRRAVLTTGWNTSERIVETPWLHRLLGKIDGLRTILDVGCADDRSSQELAQMGFLVFGLDRRRHPMTHPCFHQSTGDAGALPFRSDVFDAAVSISAIEHVGLSSYGTPVFAAGDRLALSEIRRCLKPGGFLYLTVPVGHENTLWYRIYGPDAVRRLLSDFELLEAHFYERRDGKDWIPRTEDQMNNVVSTLETGTNGVGIYFCRKRRP